MSELADVLVERLRQILAERPTTEAELRSLSERAAELERELVDELEASEARLDLLAERDDSPIAETAALLRRVDAARADLDRVRAVLENLDERARRLRSEWLLNQASSQRAS